MTNSVVISGSGLWNPPHSISNEELVDAYNAYATQFNQQNADEIESGSVTAKPLSSAEFIQKASGIRSRYCYMKDGVLDINRMRPAIPERSEEELSDQAEMAINAAKLALEAANKSADDIDVVIVSCAYTQRSYPALAIEVQEALGIQGFGFDMLVACSAATFALHRAYEMISAGTAKGVLVINPELTSPQVNYCDRDSHFIFGDVSTAMVVEHADTATSEHVFDILSTKAVTQYSNNIRSNFGYVSRANDVDPYGADKLFHQEGRKVFKEVCPMAAQHISEHLERHELTSADVKRWWLHQANINMNSLISKKLLGREATLEEAPIVLDRYANTASAGSIIAFNLYHKDLQAGDYGLLCSFGAGYSIGSLLVRKR
ncbi:beta-ketoacyl-ACP synthase III [Paraglaciecola chathamensis]|jgi:beta-ketodecanoyl-[acyl-carrier-protein] synthase|uniref:Beta-ketoacyl-ACP synthase III n=2 Tax=Paraglaciecola chathamensis TaxID=368405 RepID=A0A8H9I8G9_9ALTE|nr:MULTISPECIES: beta-ketoacyl-ACP synthase III [Paraglaciecola]AEE22015.1 Beta-ketoacyl-acyl-carrier-protein synthase I [Glaciecola sp. 4H-3-7+YE-5]MBJ2135473.1 beta-ketoacyl-ACP synthase III [Paraglaciecola chathamensis]MDO6559588.1 beta-ketoacyl-ACP synthase III [Paraglaciecola chathamensis]MDO6837957.1 beta-ketoacyl-ACP synthase III [Paraglaciecola chathamensis]GAC06714.1 3-oxoacyl-[acyl-carrier-protein] synthase III [Paraglaciecola agarilytica NO2]|tara:strand:- start:277 stop:1401 length:1125 start_codon:yes stop_codon:yes gene_type:complete